MTLVLNGTNGLSDVDGSAATPAIRGTDANTGIFFPAADTIAFSEGGVEAVRIDASGNVGIGTSSPATKLDVGGTIQALQVFQSSSGTDAVLNANGANRDVIFKVNNTELARLVGSGGHLLVGTTSGSYRVVAKNTDNNQLLLDNDGSTSTGMAYANNGTLKVFTYWHNSLARYYVTAVSSGVYLASGGTSWTSASDERVKDIIEPIENATEKLSSWRTVVGKYKTDSNGVRRSFLIAQDVLSTFPEAVDTSDENEYGVRYQDTIPVLVKAIQEQQALIITLTDRITALEAKP